MTPNDTALPQIDLALGDDGALLIESENQALLGLAKLLGLVSTSTLIISVALRLLA